MRRPGREKVPKDLWDAQMTAHHQLIPRGRRWTPPTRHHHLPPSSGDHRIKSLAGNLNRSLWDNRDLLELGHPFRCSTRRVKQAPGLITRHHHKVRVSLVHRRCSHSNQQTLSMNWQSNSWHPRHISAPDHPRRHRRAEERCTHSIRRKYRARGVRNRGNVSQRRKTTTKMRRRLTSSLVACC